MLSSAFSSERRTFVSGYWKLPGNAKRSVDYYGRHFSQLLSVMREQHLIFYSDDEQILDDMASRAAESRVSLDARHLPVMQLPAFEQSESLAKSCSLMALDQWSRPSRTAGEKGVNHYWRDLKGSGLETYRQLLCVWLSKVPLMSSLASQMPSDHGLSWVDLTIMRFSHQRSNWRFWRVSDRPGCLSHYASPMRYMGQPLPINASYLSASAQVWLLVNEIFQGSASLASAMPYGHDEETILGECQRQNPELFHCIGAPYSRLSKRAAIRARVIDCLSGWYES